MYLTKRNIGSGDRSIAPYANKDLKAHEIYREPVLPDDQPSRLNLVGYVDPNKKIKQMIEAGIRIDAWNEALYDYEREDEDDGYRMASERNDWDDLDMLTDAMREREIYKKEMYTMYRKALEAQGNSGKAEDVDGVKPETQIKDPLKVSEEG